MRRDDIHYIPPFEFRSHIDNRKGHQVVMGDIDIPISEPDQINDEIKVFGVDSLLYPFGITIEKISITLPSDAAYSMVVEEWAGDPPVHQADIETVTTTGSDSYMEVTGSDIDNQVVDADDYIFLHIPATDVDWVHVKIIFSINTNSQSGG